MFDGEITRCEVFPCAMTDPDQFTETTAFMLDMELKPGTMFYIVQRDDRIELHWYEQSGGSVDPLGLHYLRMGYRTLEIRAWSHVLDDDDRDKLRRHLAAKYGGLIEAVVTLSAAGELLRNYGGTHVDESGGVFMVENATGDHHAEQLDPEKRLKWEPRDD